MNRMMLTYLCEVPINGQSQGAYYDLHHILAINKPKVKLCIRVLKTLIQTKDNGAQEERLSPSLISTPS